MDTGSHYFWTRKSVGSYTERLSAEQLDSRTAPCFGWLRTEPAFTIIHAFPEAFSASVAGATPWELTLGSDGFLYGVTQRGAVCGFLDRECGSIFRLRPVLPGDSDVQFEVLHFFQSTTFGQNFPARKRWGQSVRGARPGSVTSM